LREPVAEGTRERALLVGLKLDGQQLEATEGSLSELRKLAKTDGATVVHQIIHQVRKPNSRTLIGKGKVEDISSFCAKHEIDLVIFDDELSPAQQRNLEDELNVTVIDRAQLILEIFARRARSSEGKLQVELAQLRYLLTRLVGKGLAMSRLGGGIGTRGPGETKLEVDRRRVNRRIYKLRRELEAVKRRRRVQRAGRDSLQIPAVALVGYTNAGKSTLFNALTNARVLADNKLFATLDPTIRKLPLPDGGAAVLSDTVGFIRKLPHELIAAFKSTLEEVVEADLLLHVIDASSARWAEQAATVRRVLQEIGAGEKPMIEALNKIDLVENSREVERLLFSFENGIPLSARHGRGLEELLKAIQSELHPVIKHVKCTIPYGRGDIISMIHEKGKVLHREYRQDSVVIEADIEYRYTSALKEFERNGVINKN